MTPLKIFVEEEKIKMSSEPEARTAEQIHKAWIAMKRDPTSTLVQRRIKLLDDALKASFKAGCVWEEKMR